MGYKKGRKPADLSAVVDRVKVEKDIAKKKKIAFEMAEIFTLGGEDKFKQSIIEARSPSEVDKICYNTLLKGEGLGVKKS